MQNLINSAERDAHQRALAAYLATQAHPMPHPQAAPAPTRAEAGYERPHQPRQKSRPNWTLIAIISVTALLWVGIIYRALS